MYKLLLKRIKKVMQEKGYAIFEGDKPYLLNIVGIRSDNPVPDKFDDHLLVFYRNARGRECFKWWKITTDPGLYCLKNPVAPKGTAILCEGQYPGVYRLGIFRGERALIQQAPMNFVRDANRDNVLDFNSGRKEAGIIGANIHRAMAVGVTPKVGKWSAGGQVFSNAAAFEKFLYLCELHRMYWGNTFSYTLIGEKDLTGYAG